MWDVLFSECVLIIIVLVRVGVEVLLLSGRDGCEVMFGNGVVVEIDVIMVILVVLFVICCNNIVGGLVFGVIILFIVVVVVVENVLGGKLFVFEVMFLDVEVWIGWDGVDIVIIVGIVEFEIVLEDVGDLDIDIVVRLFEVIIFVLVVVIFTMFFLVGSVVLDCIIDVEMLLRGLFVIGIDIDGVDVVIVWILVMLVKKGENVGFVMWLKFGGVVLGFLVIWLCFSLEKVCWRLRDEVEWDKFILGVWDVEVIIRKENKNKEISLYIYMD